MPIDTTLHQLYIGYFGRPADKFGFNHWESVAAGNGLGQVTKAFAASGEFAAVMGRSSVHFVDAVFQNLFGRLPDPATRDAWVARLARDDAPLERFVLEMIDSASSADAQVLALKTAAAASFTASLDLLGDVANLLIPAPTLLATGGAYLAGVKDSPSLDLALTGLVDTVMTLPVAVNQPGATAPAQPLVFDASSMTQEIGALYIGYFGRPADPAGFAYWEQVLATSGMGQIRTAFTQSAEFKAQSQGLSPAHVVNSVYVNSFGHDADLPGLAYWTDLIARNAISIEQVVESVQRGAQGADAAILRDKLILAASLTATVDAVDVLPGWGPIQSGQAKTLLAGLDGGTPLEDLMGNVVEVARLIGGLEPPPYPLPTF